MWWTYWKGDGTVKAGSGMSRTQSCSSGYRTPSSSHPIVPFLWGCIQSSVHFSMSNARVSKRLWIYACADHGESTIGQIFQTDHVDIVGLVFQGLAPLPYAPLHIGHPSKQQLLDYANLLLTGLLHQCGWRGRKLAMRLGGLLSVEHILHHSQGHYIYWSWRWGVWWPDRWATRRSQFHRASQRGSS